MSTFAFSSTPELMFGLYLLYYFRVFERQIGSNKYSVSDACSSTLFAWYIYIFSCALCFLFTWKTGYEKGFLVIILFFPFSIVKFHYFLSLTKI